MNFSLRAQITPALLTAATSLLCLWTGPAHAALQVVATTTDLAALARDIGGRHVEVTALAVAGEDPHFVDARPSLILPLNRAQLLLVNGLDLEVGWLPTLLVAARNPSVQRGAAGYFDASTYITPLQAPQGKVDRAMGDVHPGGNPHFLLDPRAAAAVVQALGQVLCERDPDHAGHYRAQANRLTEELRTLAAHKRQQLLNLPAEQRRVVVYHESMSYLNDWLGLEQVATIEPRPGVPPNPAHVASVLATMRRTHATVILQEDYYPRKTSETLAKLASATTVALQTATHINDGERYVDHIAHVATEVLQALTRQPQTR